MVVKIQRPGLDVVVAEDLAILKDLARLAQTRTSLGRVYDLPAIVDEFSDTLSEELDYRLEANNAARLRSAYADEPQIRVPTIHSKLSSRRVLTMERLRGVPIDHLSELDAAGIDRSAVAACLLRVTMRSILRDGFFHADPHPGNFLVAPNGVIGIMDFGMVGRLDAEGREDLVLFLSSMAARDSGRMVDRLLEMGIAGRPEQLASFRGDLGRFVAVHWEQPGRGTGAGRIFDALLSLARRNGVRIPSSFVLVTKTLAMQEENARRLDPTLDLAGILEPVIQEAARELSRPGHLASRLQEASLDAGELAMGLPRRAGRILSQLEHGGLSVRAHLEEMDTLRGSLRRDADRIALAILAAGSLVAAPAFLQARRETRWAQGTQHLLFAVTLATSAVLGARLALSFLTSRD